MAFDQELYNQVIAARKEVGALHNDHDARHTIIVNMITGLFQAQMRLLDRLDAIDQKLADLKANQA